LSSSTWRSSRRTSINAAADEIERLRQDNQKLIVAAQKAAIDAQMAALDTQQEVIKSEQDCLAKDYKIAELNLKLQEQEAVHRVTGLAESIQI